MKTTHTSKQVYNQYATEYDEWFDKHFNLYQSELLALKKAIPENKTGIEIGVGTGRFAQPLNIKFGVEPSESMAILAEQRGVKVYKAFAENLPIEKETFDFALMVTTVCFLSDIPKAFQEAHRILKTDGEIIIAIIDKNSELGKKYEKEKENNKFYKDAHFHSAEELTTLLEQSGFHSFSYWQTLTKTSETEIEQPTRGFGKGSFVVIRASKKNSIT
ncbi:class I SAM-dependent methyltransferase [Flavobacterium sp.]|uniref:class I SAM-dependent DNA methyltransferase n=1 Tax=Flavobacterium sp. TaxID=239 RepID=UPI002B4B0CDB|nr:class I SAM-dependent methyltransferase [Flavobacterium sp.]HLF52917.1 class I SAM-dependent methyltransferase [Flavobacterium sp.]